MHEGQFACFKVRLPVFLARRPVEPLYQDLVAFYTHLQATRRDAGVYVELAPWKCHLFQVRATP